MKLKHQSCCPTREVSNTLPTTEDVTEGASIRYVKMLERERERKDRKAILGPARTSNFLMPSIYLLRSRICYANQNIAGKRDILIGNNEERSANLACKILWKSKLIIVSYLFPTYWKTFEKNCKKVWKYELASSFESISRSVCKGFLMHFIASH